MTAEEKELRAALLGKGFTAPTSWKAARLQKELTKLSQTKADASSDQKTSSDEKSDEAADEKTDSTDDKAASEEAPQADSEQAPLVDETPSETTEKLTDENESPANVDDEAADTEELDDKVWLKAKTAFSNPRLNLKNIKEGNKLAVNAADAKFLVEVDRTCEYSNA